ncbi:lactate dehydrogenase-like 2-hydroxyacid dehydrogenase [Paraburkholderia sp. GAS448]|uniref:2-hydroxyacid dehydrogenase n=1 Tax=Paraburkholderia sp. GAS448 TaxID=3035136 RepID=UPI003D261BB6
MKPSLLVLIPLPGDSHADISASFDIIHAPTPTQRRQAIADHGSTIRAVLSNGTTGLTAAEIDRLPQLEFVSALGAGYENIAVDHARVRNIVVVNGAGTNDDCVADHAFALLLAVVRDVPQRDIATRNGVWRDALPMRPAVSGKRLGIVGLGNIGQKVARRAAGFDLETGYHNRKPREGATSRYFDSLLALAQWSDYLVIATPGGASTHHLIDRTVLEALGPKGFLINVSRGSVVDTAALAAALTEGTIAGAGLDVYEGEPHPPQALLPLRNVVLTPHTGGTSPESNAASVRNFIDNATRHFAGEAVLTPI